MSQPLQRAVNHWAELREQIIRFFICRKRKKQANASFFLPEVGSNKYFCCTRVDRQLCSVSRFHMTVCILRFLNLFLNHLRKKKNKTRATEAMRWITLSGSNLTLFFKEMAL